jgi:hypothetical protein
MNISLNILLGLFAFSALSLSAQDDEDFEDLRILYMDGKYEKLIKKADRYTDDDDTRKDPTPYLYLSKAYYEMSRMEEFAEDYPPEKAFRDALKWASKYRRKDKQGELFDENDLYFRELKESALIEANGLISDQKYSRAKRYFDSICDFDPTDPGAWLMLGICKVEIRNVREAEMDFQKAGEVLHTRDLSTLNSIERKLLRDGILTYSDYLVEQSMRDSARVTMELAKPVLEGDREFDMKYGSL